jgi:hypothetical protein
VFDGSLYSAPATVTIIISHVNHTPIANNDQYFINEHTSINSIWLDVAAPGVMGNDNDPDNDTLTTVVDTYTAHGLMQLNPDGSLSYLPDMNWYGVDTFTYHVTDGYLNSNIATVTINVIRTDSDLDGTWDDQDCDPLNNTVWRIVATFADPDLDVYPDTTTVTNQCVGFTIPAGWTTQAPPPLDNCPGIANADQHDTDSDGIGDACAIGTLRVRLTFDPINYPSFKEWATFGTGCDLGIPDEFPQMGYGTTMVADFRCPSNTDSQAIGYFLMATNALPGINPSVDPAAVIFWFPFGIGSTYYSGLPQVAGQHNGITSYQFSKNVYGSNPAYDSPLTNWALLPNGQGGANIIVCWDNVNCTFPTGTVSTVTIGIPVDSDNDHCSDDRDPEPYNPLIWAPAPICPNL